MAEKRKPRRGPTTMLGGLLGVFAFLAFLIVIQAGFILSAAAALAAFAAGWLIANDRPATRVKLDGMDSRTMDRTLSQAEAKLAEFESWAKKIETRSIARKAEQIAELERKIIDDLIADPKDYVQARNFLTYYQDAAINILRKYVNLAERGAGASEAGASVSKVEPILETIRTAFEKQLARLLENDVLDLDLDIAVLEKTIKAEGWDKA